jgi:hypothetical protein
MRDLEIAAAQKVQKDAPAESKGTVKRKEPMVNRFETPHEHLSSMPSIRSKPTNSFIKPLRVAALPISTSRYVSSSSSRAFSSSAS